MQSPIFGSSPDDDLHAGMKSVFDDLAASRTGIQDDLSDRLMPREPVPWGAMTPAAAMGSGDAGAASGGPSVDAVALAMGLNGSRPGAPRESHLDRARRILSGQPAPVSSGDVNIDNAMGVSSLRTRLAAQRQNRLDVMPNMPTADDTPEIAANKENYLDLLTLRGAGDPLGTNIEEAMGGSTIDQRRAAVQAMADRGATMSIDPKEKNRRAIIAAMNPISAPDPANPGKMITRAPTPEEAMLGFSRAGGTGLTMDGVMRTMDSEALAKGAGAKGAKADATDEFNKMIGSYKSAMDSKDYIAARFWAQKLGHKFPTKDKDDQALEFSNEMLPGYKADGSAAAGPTVNLAPNGGVAPAGYKSADDVIAAFKAGTIERAAAKEILQKQFGHQ